MPIRTATPNDLPRLQEIEVAAGRAFAAIGMDAVAQDEPAPIEVLAEHQRDGRIRVQVDDEDRPIGYLWAEVVDGAGHVEQVSVDPAAAGRGLGRELIDDAARWARSQGFDRLTLTTFTEVAWNGPYYRRLGFRELPAGALTPELRHKREEEGANGLDRWPRTAMMLDLADGGRGG